MSIALAIYLPNLDSGGAERAQLNLAPELTAQGFEVTFVLNQARGAYLSLVPDGVRLVSLNASRSLSAIWPLARFLRKERPPVLLSHLGFSNVVAIVAARLAGVNTKVIVTQHNPIISSDTQKRKSGLLPWLYRIFLPRAAGIVAVSSGVADNLAQVSGVDRSRIHVIYNPVVTRDFERRTAERGSHAWLNESKIPFILAVGRLVELKDFHMLLDAFAMVAREREARLILLGEGPLSQSLAAHVKGLGMADRVSMPGFVANPLPFMRQAAVLALSSRYEGFGNVLAEALACGTPVVSTDCPYGPREILKGGAFGKLVAVGDAQAMAAALLETLASEPDREALSRRGMEFSAGQTAQDYKKLVAEVCSGSKNSA